MPTINYTLQDGTPVKGVTTLLNNVSFGPVDGLIGWGVALAAKGLNFKQERTRLADLGTLLHGVVENFPDEPTPDVYRGDYERAKAVYENHARWLATTDAEVILQEKTMVSEKMKFGGCPDMVFRVPGHQGNFLADVKTGKGWGEGKTVAQMAAYGFLLAEHGIPVESAVILHHTQDFKLRIIDISREKMEAGFEVFKRAVELESFIKGTSIRGAGRLV